MAHGSTFTEAIISQLGTPREPIGFGEIAVIAIIVAYIIFECVIGGLLARLLGFNRRNSRPDQKPPDEP